MPSKIDEREIGFTCPTCGEMTFKSLGWIKEHKSDPVECSACNQPMNIPADDIIAAHERQGGPGLTDFSLNIGGKRR
jgi:transcription elongation factor Elf1